MRSLSEEIHQIVSKNSGSVPDLLHQLNLLRLAYRSVFMGGQKPLVLTLSMVQKILETTDKTEDESLKNQCKAVVFDGLFCINMKTALGHVPENFLTQLRPLVGIDFFAKTPEERLDIINCLSTNEEFKNLLSAYVQSGKFLLAAVGGNLDLFRKYNPYYQQFLRNEILSLHQLAKLDNSSTHKIKELIQGPKRYDAVVFQVKNRKAETIPEQEPEMPRQSSETQSPQTVVEENTSDEVKAEDMHSPEEPKNKISALPYLKTLRTIIEEQSFNLNRQWGLFGGSQININGKNKLVPKGVAGIYQVICNVKPEDRQNIESAMKKIQGIARQALERHGDSNDHSPAKKFYEQIVQELTNANLSIIPKGRVEKPSIMESLHGL